MAADSLVSRAAQEQASRLRVEQERFLEDLRRLDPLSATLYTYREAFNGVAIVVEPQAVESIRRLRGVKAVYPDRWHTTFLDASLPLIRAEVIWAALGGQANAGAGVKVAVVDTGVRPENPCFDGSGFTAPPGFPLADDWCGSVDPSFCNGKLIAARHFSAGFGTLDAAEVESPLAVHGHGVHVAGIAVCNAGVVATSADGVPELISGVAPGAHLMVYKALWWVSGRSTGTTSDLLAAVNAAIADGADVINNSWGRGGSGGLDSPFPAVWKAAERLGVVMVTAAGNLGPGERTIACPANIESGISVANTGTNRVHGVPFDVTGPGAVPDRLRDLAAVVGSGPAITGEIGPAPIVYAEVSSESAEGCHPFPSDSLSGALALVSGRGCFFSTVQRNVAEAGGRALTFFTIGPGIPVRMAGLSPTIPAVMIDHFDGRAVRSWLEKNPDASGRIGFPLTRLTNDRWQDNVNSRSSRGPNLDPGFIKPDLAAPGSSILSAWSPDHRHRSGEFSILTGTSMASPHVAGAAALLRQLHPEWSAVQIKTALTSTADGGVRKEDTVAPADPFDSGSGRLDLGAAVRAGVTFDRPSMADPFCYLECSFQAHSITNVAGTATSWKARVVPLDNPRLKVTVSPAKLDLAAGESAVFKVDVDSTGAHADAWDFTRVVWQEESGAMADASLPVAVFSPTSTDSRFVSVASSAAVTPPGGILDFTIAVNNQSIIGGPTRIVNVLPDSVTFLDADPVEVNGVAEVAPSFEPGPPGVLTYSARLEPQTLELVPAASPIGYLPLAGSVEPLPCTELCDDTYITLGADFFFLGERQSSVVMSTNGFLLVGNDAVAASDPVNQALPDPTLPNGVLAPFWTDLDLDGTDPEDSGAGSMYFAFVEAGGSRFLVYEWSEVELAGGPGESFTFQVWIELGSSNIWFVYAAIPLLPDVVTVGIEDELGLSGGSRFVNGDGAAPEVGVDLRVMNTPGGRAVMTYRTRVNEDAKRVVNVVEVHDEAGAVASAYRRTEVAVVSVR